MRFLDFGSLNRDFVYKVPHILQPGETLASTDRAIHCGGKGLNQSLALARAGAQVFHAGCIGSDGTDLLQLLQENAVDTSCLRTVDGPSGHTVIQVDAQGQNSILLFGGANHALTPEQIDVTLSHFGPEDLLLLQNETNLVPELLKAANRKGIRVIWNPSPMPLQPQDYPLDCVSWFVVNEIEGAQLTGKQEPLQILQEMRRRFPRAKTLLTLGSEGSVYDDGQQLYRTGCVKVPVADTTAAGDTFLGYFFALLEELGPQRALETASAAAAMAVSVEGAANSIPTRSEVEVFLKNR